MWKLPIQKVKNNGTLKTSTQKVIAIAYTKVGSLREVLHITKGLWLRKV